MTLQQANSLIDLSRELNPARDSALQWAVHRANQERKPMFVYVGPPNTPQSLTPTKFNVWFVRSQDEGKPEGKGVELFHTQAPEAL